MSHSDPGPLAAYNSLQDKNLVGYFNNNRMRRHLRKSGLINRQGEIVTESTYRLTMARKEHQGHVRDLMAQAIVHKALDMERHRQASIKKKLEEIAKVELVRRVKIERARKGDEDIIPFLSPRAPTQRPHSAYSHQRRLRRGSSQRPLTAPINTQRTCVYVDEDGFPIHRDRSSSNTSEEIDSHNLRELDPRIMDSISLHLRPEDREGLAPYKVNQALKPHPPIAHMKRSQPRPSKKKTVFSKDGKKIRQKSHKGSLALHRKEPAFPHASQLQTMCDVTLHYRGNNLKIQYEREDLRDEIMIYQQHCGGENLLVFEGLAEPGTDIVFTSRRHRGYPFSATFFVNRVQSLRLSACCEYKYTPHSLLGGSKGHFKFIRVDGAAPCYRCMVEAELARRERQRYRGTQTDQPDPPPEPVPEKNFIATQTEETGEEEEHKEIDGYEDDFDEEDDKELKTPRNESDSSEGESEAKAKQGEAGSSDHVYPESEKSDTKGQDGYSDFEFEDVSEKKEGSDVNEEETDEEIQKGGNNDQIGEGNIKSKGGVGSIRAEVTEEKADDEVESARAGSASNGPKDEKEMDDKEKNDVISTLSERGIGDQEDIDTENQKGMEKKGQERDNVILGEHDNDLVEDTGEEERILKLETGTADGDTDSESDLNFEADSSDDDGATSVQSKSITSLKDSDDEFQPFSRSSSSGSERGEEISEVEGRNIGGNILENVNSSKNGAESEGAENRSARGEKEIGEERDDKEEDIRKEEVEGKSKVDRKGEILDEHETRNKVRWEDKKQLDEKAQEELDERVQRVSLDSEEQVVIDEDSKIQDSNEKDVNMTLVEGEVPSHQSVVTEEREVEHAEEENGKTPKESLEDVRVLDENNVLGKAEIEGKKQPAVTNDVEENEAKDTDGEMDKSGSYDVKRDENKVTLSSDGPSERQVTREADSDRERLEKHGDEIEQEREIGQTSVVETDGRSAHMSEDDMMERKEKLDGPLEKKPNEDSEYDKQDNRDEAQGSEMNVDDDKKGKVADEADGADEESSELATQEENKEDVEETQEDETESEEEIVSSGSEEDQTRSKITVLNLTEKGITSERATKLAASLLKPRYRQIKYLLLRSNPIGDKGLTSIVQSLIKLHHENSDGSESGLTLTHLDLGDTQITNKGFNELAELLKLPTKLENLNISDNTMSRLGWLALAAGVRENTAMKTLSVEYLKLGDEGCREMCEAVADSKTLTELNLEGNDIGDDGGEAILKMLRDNEKIEIVNFKRDNNIPSHIDQEIRDLL